MTLKKLHCRLAPRRSVGLFVGRLLNVWSLTRSTLRPHSVPHRQDPLKRKLRCGRGASSVVKSSSCNYRGVAASVASVQSLLLANFPEASSAIP